jgi:intracellular sulfur oxidation DsrE/DsrF family protein
MNMLPDQQIELLNAYADGQLDEARRLTVLKQLAQDAHLRRQLADIQLLKSLVNSAYAPHSVSMKSANLPRHRLGAMPAMAASLLVMLSLSLGWLGHALWPTSEVPPVISMGAAKTPGNYLLQMSAGNVVAWQQSIAEMQRLLSLSPQVNVELLVNEEAIAMLSNDSVVSDQLKQLLAQTHRVTLSACRQGLERWRERGISVKLMPEVETSRSALEEIVHRIDEGWHLVPVPSLVPV